MSKIKKFLIIAVLIAAAVSVFLLVLANQKGRSQSAAIGENLNQESSAGAPQENWKTYSHPGYGFSFDYPADWNASSFAENDGETILIQNSKFKNQNSGGGAQIFISMFDEPETALTRERILQDIPDLKIDNDQQIKIAGTIDALSFDSVNQSNENTKEVWFVHNNFLYQITATEGSRDVLDKMIETWKFSG